MKYILDNAFALRGFENGKVKRLLNLETNSREDLTPQMMEFLKLCDGETDMNSLILLFPFFAGNEKEAVEKGWIKKAGQGQKLRKEQQYLETALKEIGFIQWSVTGKCNANCRHCFISESQKKHDDLSTDEVVRVLDELARHSILSVSLTGGEPLIRKDLPDILKAMSQRHIKMTGLSTNGFLLTEEMIDMFFEYGMKPAIQISFDGVRCHDWMRGVEGAEDMAIRAMESCRKKDVPFGISMCVHEKNKHLIAETVELAAAKGAHIIRVALTGETSDEKQKKNGIEILSINELAPVYLDYLKKFCTEKPDITLELCGFVKLHGKTPEQYCIIPEIHSCTNLKTNRVCEAVEHSFYITDDGKLLPCIIVGGTVIENDCFKITEHSIPECMASIGYRKFLELSAYELIQHNPECRNCKYIELCGCGCRGAALFSGGSMLAADKSRCDFFKNRYSAMIRETIGSCLKGTSGLE